MGGQSKSALVIEDGVAKFTGDCAIVPFLKAPGFITMVTGGFFMSSETFPDVSSCQGLSFTLKTNVDYQGYRVSFGKVHLPEGHHASGYKAPMTNLPMDDFGDVVIPFDQFSSKWDEATGDIIVECSEDPKYCPSQKWLSNMKTMSFWGEGVEGKVDLEIQQIRAVGCSAAVGSSSSSSSTSLSSLAANISPGHVSTSGGLFLFLIVGVVAMGVLMIRQRRPKQSYQEIQGNDIELNHELA